MKPWVHFVCNRTLFYFWKRLDQFAYFSTNELKLISWKSQAWKFLIQSLSANISVILYAACFLEGEQQYVHSFLKNNGPSQSVTPPSWKRVVCLIKLGSSGKKEPCIRNRNHTGLWASLTGIFDHWELMWEETAFCGLCHYCELSCK